MPDQTTGTQAGNEGNQGNQEQGQAQGQPAAPPKAFSQEDVNRLLAREVAKAKRDLGSENEQLRAQLAEKAELEKRLQEFEAKEQTAAEKERTKLDKAKADWEKERNELLKTVQATKSAADSTAIDAALSRVVMAKVPKENSPSVVQRELARQCIRKPDGSVVYKDPETDEEIAPEKALEAYLTANPCFTIAPASGTGATSGYPPGDRRKPIAKMSSDELTAAADAELGA
jgi:hypothetical protein